MTAESYAGVLIAHGLPGEEAVAIAELIAWVLDGRNANLTDGVQRAVGRPSRDFRVYARATAATGGLESSRSGGLIHGRHC